MPLRSVVRVAMRQFHWAPPTPCADAASGSASWSGERPWGIIPANWRRTVPYSSCDVAGQLGMCGDAGTSWPSPMGRRRPRARTRPVCPSMLAPQPHRPGRPQEVARARPMVRRRPGTSRPHLGVREATQRTFHPHFRREAATTAPMQRKGRRSPAASLPRSRTQWERTRVADSRRVWVLLVHTSISEVGLLRCLWSCVGWQLVSATSSWKPRESWTANSPSHAGSAP